jgi:hypothetical protein
LQFWPTISTFVERAIFDQLTDFFNFHFHPSLSAFRKGFGCQAALLKIIEDWKKALDENKYFKENGTQNKTLWHSFIHCFKRATNIFYLCTLFSTRKIAV